MVVPARRAGAEGVVSLMRAEPAHGVVEVGAIVLGPGLQRTTAATEAMWLLARHVFGLGYRRYEWKCDALNAPSRSAAVRLGFRFEGVFRQAVVTKGRNRDTAWFAMTDGDWSGAVPGLRPVARPGELRRTPTAAPASGVSLSRAHGLARHHPLTACGTAFPHAETPERSA